MKKIIYLVLCCLTGSSLFAQYEQEFLKAYNNKPYIPKGLLEAVAYTNTHIQNISSDYQPSCTGMPLPYGVMGVFDNGADYFRLNGVKIAELSGISVAEQKRSVENQISAYAIAFNKRMQEVTEGNTADVVSGKLIRFVLTEFSEIPLEGQVNQYAIDLQIYEILRRMEDADFTDSRSLPRYSFDHGQIFGTANSRMLGSSRINLTEEGIVDGQNPALRYNYQQANVSGVTRSADYGPAIWNAAPSCNYSSRSGTAVSAVTIHTIQGSYAGAISWSQNCSSNVSYHYVIRSSDGQVTQMVLESNKAWHVGSENPYTIGYEHEGYINDASWYTEAMYTSSAALTRDVVNSGYGIPALRTYYLAATTGVNVLGACTKIKGHQHYPSQTHTDPGINWNWEKYYKLINNNPTITSLTAASGTFYDTGGSTGNYSNDERKLWLIKPTGATSVSLTFSSFNLENNYDHMLIYNGSTTSSPLIGRYTGTSSPGTVTGTSGALLVEFRSDCATVAPGWAASWGSSATSTKPTTSVPVDNAWKSGDFTVNFTDASPSSPIQARFYLPGVKSAGSNGWKARNPLGFLNEDFEDDRVNWTDASDTWVLSGGVLKNTSATNTNTNVYANVIQSVYSTYMYHWRQKITSTGSNQRAGLHFFCDNGAATNRGNSYFVFFREATNKVQLYKVTSNVFTLVKEDDVTVTVGTQYDYRVIYNPSTGWIKVYSNGVLILSWQDSSPLTAGSSVSLRTGDCIAEFDNVRMYRSRGTSANVTVGSLGMFNQNSSGGVRSGLLRSYVINDNDVWSDESYQTYLVDYTTALASKLSLQSLLSKSQLQKAADFEFEDQESGVEHIMIAVGSSPNATDIMDWTDVSSLNQYIIPSLDNDLLYYVNFKVTNGAGLNSEFSIDSKNTVLAAGSASSLENVKIYPNPAEQYLIIDGITEHTLVTIIDASGKLIYQERLLNENQIDISRLSSGVYQLQLLSENNVMVKSFVKK